MNPGAMALYQVRRVSKIGFRALGIAPIVARKSAYLVNIQSDT
ncbi:hypothetical protein ACPOL_2487 [Acidisarcina polymorpha]|uniref:Uncharacterized protein n=1 Tax=Acidisarcina polymorpha TaxID=2211140 RepID=A0A2Z5FY50_9BACT|nr:hypothetical protein ACPOL_2487 [Acidisarcina polymorpha]